jgi:hypothetical protein
MKNELKEFIKEGLTEIVKTDETLREIDIRITLRRHGSEEEIRESAQKVGAVPVPEGDDHAAVNLRFFQAMDFLIETKKLKNKKAFSDRYSLNRGNVAAVRVNYQKYSIRPVWLTYLVRDYGVSADWLLTGRGEILS